MSYSSRAAYMHLAPGLATIAGRDKWVKDMAAFAEFAGWQKTLVGSFFEAETTNPALSYEFFGGSPANDVFWKVVRLSDSACKIVGDAIPSGYSPTCPFIGTGDTSIPNTHAGVVAAILALFPAYQAQPISPSKTRFIADTITNSGPVVTVGSALHTNLTPPGSGGYLLKCQANKRTVNKNGLATAYGDNNWIQVLLIQQVAPFGNIAIAASKGFLAYPPDTPQAPAGAGPVVGFRTAYSGWRNDIETFSFCNPYQWISHRPKDPADPFAPDTSEDYFECGAGKLMDLRRNITEDLPVTEAVWYAANTGAGTSLHHSCRSGGNILVVLNGVGRFQQTTDSPGDPQLVILQSARAGTGEVSDVNGVPWESDCPAGPKFEPWLAFNPFNKDNPGAAVAQAVDMVTIYQVYTDPQNAGTFSWDGQTWRPYTKNGSITAVHPAGTVCLRVTDTFIPPP